MRTQPSLEPTFPPDPQFQSLMGWLLSLFAAGARPPIQSIKERP